VTNKDVNISALFVSPSFYLCINLNYQRLSIVSELGARIRRRSGKLKIHIMWKSAGGGEIIVRPSLLLSSRHMPAIPISLDLSSSKLFNNITSSVFDIVAIRIIRQMSRRPRGAFDSVAMLSLDIGFGAVCNRSHGYLALEILESCDLTRSGRADGKLGYGALGGGSLAASSCCGAAGAGADLR